MNEIKINHCREHWQHLAPHVKKRATAKHLLAAVEIAEQLLRENNKLEMENRVLRSTQPQALALPSVPDYPTLAL